MRSLLKILSEKSETLGKLEKCYYPLGILGDFPKLAEFSEVGRRLKLGGCHGYESTHVDSQQIRMFAGLQVCRFAGLQV